MPKCLRRQVKAIFIWYPKEREDFKVVHDENNELTDDELVIVRNFSNRQNKQAFTYKMNITVGLRY